MPTQQNNIKLRVSLIHKELSIEEITVRQYKNILKCLFGERPNSDRVLQTFAEIFAENSDESTEFFLKDITSIDFLLLCIYMRVFGKGSMCGLTVKAEESELEEEQTPEEQKAKEQNINLNLEVFYGDVKTKFKNFVQKQISWDNFALNLTLPSISQIIQNESLPNGLFLSSIDSISIENHVTKFETPKQTETFLNEVPTEIYMETVKHFNNFIQTCNNTNLLSRYKAQGKEIAQLHFTPSTGFFVWILKLLFEIPLSYFYDTLFYLSHTSNFNLIYLENASVSEYNYYVSLLEGIHKSQGETE